MIKFFLQAIRIDNIMIGIICCLLVLFKVPANNWHDFFLGLLSVILLMIGSNLANDIYDIKVDKINKPKRTLITHPNLKNPFKIIASTSFFVSVFLSYYINSNAFLIIIFSIPILLLYTPILKGVPLLGNIVVSFYLGLVFIFIEVCLSNSLDAMILPAFFAFGISLIREIIKDIEDYKGDKAEKVYTLPVFLGIKKSMYFSCFLMLCFLFFCGKLIFTLNNFYYNISVFFLVFMPISYLIFFLVKSPTSKSCFKASALLKKVTILGLVIIYIL